MKTDPLSTFLDRLKTPAQDSPVPITISRSVGGSDGRSARTKQSAIGKGSSTKTSGGSNSTKRSRNVSKKGASIATSFEEESMSKKSDLSEGEEEIDSVKEEESEDKVSIKSIPKSVSIAKSRPSR